MKLNSLLSLATAALLTTSLTAQTSLRFSGSTTLEKSIRPFAAEVGKAHHVTLELVPSGAGHGLEDLVAGKAQAAMFAGSMAVFVAQINEKTPGRIDPAKLTVHPLFEMSTVIIVHKSNTVPSLSSAQIRDLFSGKISNWKEVGGPDAPVMVVLPSLSDGTRSVVTEKIMNGTAYTPSARMIQNAPDMNKVVAQLPGAVAFMSPKNAAPEVRAIVPSEPIVVPFSFITMGQANEPLLSVIADLSARLK